MSAQNSKKQKARFFVLAFALSFFVLAMMGLIVVFVLNPVEEENPSSQISTDAFYLPQEEDNLTILLTGALRRKKPRFSSPWSGWICWRDAFLLFCFRLKRPWMNKPATPLCLRLIKKAARPPQQKR